MPTGHQFNSVKRQKPRLSRKQINALIVLTSLTLIFKCLDDIFVLLHVFSGLLLTLAAWIPSHDLQETLGYVHTWTKAQSFFSLKEVVYDLTMLPKAKDQPVLVVAHYRENIAWLNDYVDSSHRVYLYCKDPVYCTFGLSDRVKNSEKLVITHLPNVGREAHSYLFHINSHYPNIDRRTVFTLASLNYNPHRKISFLRAYHNDQPEAIVTELSKATQTSIGDYRITVKGRAYSLGDGYDRKKPTSQVILEPIKPLSVWARHYLGKNFFNQSISLTVKPTCHGAIFTASPKQIKTYSQSVYQSLLKRNSRGDLLEAGYYMERLWRNMYAGVTVYDD